MTKPTVKGGLAPANAVDVKGRGRNAKARGLPGLSSKVLLSEAVPSWKASARCHTWQSTYCACGSLVQALHRAYWHACGLR